MSWSIGYDSDHDRDIGYGVPAVCDHPGCNNEIDRGLSHVCGGEPYGGEHGCGLFFCEEHLFFDDGLPQLCERCCDGGEPFDKKPDSIEWMEWKLTHPSWRRWREENKERHLILREEFCKAFAARQAAIYSKKDSIQ